jgi:hypothetical protein
MLYMWWVAPYHTITLQVAASSVEERGVRSQFLAEMLLFRYDKSSHTLHITHTNTRSTSYTYERCWTYFICGGQLYDCVLTPLSSQYPWPSQVWRRGVDF